jgi:uncharacterized protein YcbK (DUF882 family)
MHSTFNQIVKTYSGLFSLLLSVAFASCVWAEDGSKDIGRYFFQGDGKITLYSERVKKSFSGSYRKGNGSYDEKALKKICRVFEAPYAPSRIGLSLRLIEFIDYLEDHLNRGAKITVVSGYRKPEYNAMLRKKGNLAAKASLHQYGMAVDLKIEGVEAEDLWYYVRHINFGGAGYYHGDVVHIDVGPARFWDENTSGVGTGISDGNKLIGIITDYDIYRPGMTITLRFIRMTAFPIFVNPKFSLAREGDRDKLNYLIDFKPNFNMLRKDGCLSFNNIDDMDNIKWKLPMNLKSGRYKIEARFCGDSWPDMPRQVGTPVFKITTPQW